MLPSLSTGASNKESLRAKGMPSYGIGPASSEEERLLESSYYRFVEFTWNVVTEEVAVLNLRGEFFGGFAAKVNFRVKCFIFNDLPGNPGMRVDAPVLE